MDCTAPGVDPPLLIDSSAVAMAVFRKCIPGPDCWHDLGDPSLVGLAVRALVVYAPIAVNRNPRPLGAGRLARHRVTDVPSTGPIDAVQTLEAMAVTGLWTRSDDDFDSGESRPSTKKTTHLLLTGRPRARHRSRQCQNLWPGDRLLVANPHRLSFTSQESNRVAAPGGRGRRSPATSNRAGSLSTAS